MAGSVYYDEKLSGKRLERCYRIASPRVEQYFEAEIRHVLDRIRPTDAVLELGCGYGRVTTRLAKAARRTVGIDSAAGNIAYARSLDTEESCEFLILDALALGFPDKAFDVVVCIQNGICAFNVDRQALVLEALRVTRRGGIVLFSSYSDRFWPYRLAWFETQFAEGLVGPIDYAASKNGSIVCTDGFRAGRMTPGDFSELCTALGVRFTTCEIDDSVVFCEIAN
ncbi:hypothetical protein DSCO28_45240 [Desulfosarcina ovata subsp. sediminis]|uniref:Methyltransferase domain-containing protein n=1 Tax=Desulfosarcina ovata subsp. sediminis TaxID=885957 RepID=A0A5K7ZUS6_9BACT|nr:class I SAM-dependent methyltransferase [Desulfosarcina ovata]BBO83958.1 hypothetical protein DSCO28_45240 [Desulfosarcina ovata subsp. sediminis]